MSRYLVALVVIATSALIAYGETATGDMPKKHSAKSAEASVEGYVARLRCPDGSKPALKRQHASPASADVHGAMFQVTCSDGTTGAFTWQGESTKAPASFGIENRSGTSSTGGRNR
jgi:hypothetical protein